MNVCAKYRCAPLRIKKLLGIFRELITTTRRTSRVAFWDPPSGSKNKNIIAEINILPVENDRMPESIGYDDVRSDDERVSRSVFTEV